MGNWSLITLDGCTSFFYQKALTAKYAEAIALGGKASILPASLGHQQYVPFFDVVSETLRSFFYVPVEIFNFL